MDAMPNPAMKSQVLRAVFRAWRGLKNATSAFFNGLLVPLEILNLPFVLLGCRTRAKSAQIATPVRFRIHLARI
jgi:hypothetical protein